MALFTVTLKQQGRFNSKTHTEFLLCVVCDERNICKTQFKIKLFFTLTIEHLDCLFLDLFISSALKLHQGLFYGSFCSEKNK